MIPVVSRNSQHIAVFGLGASGRAAAHALTAGGGTVTAWDDNADSRKEATNANIVLADPVTLDWSRQDALILSPGVPLTHPQPHPAAQAALAAGKPVIGDIDLLFENVGDAKLIGITGTNGKSTTSALIQHVLQVAGLPVQIGGNFGPPVLGLDPISSDDTVVLELSSYQLDLIDNAAFDIAVFLNLTPDHLDRHGDMDGYAAAKKRIFRNTRGERQIAVIGVDDDHGAAIADELSGWPGWIVIPVSTGQFLENGVSVIEGSLSDQDRRGCNVSGIDTLRGRHNWQNAAAAWSVARALDIDPEVIAQAFLTFRGLPHRLESVATIAGIRFINDSKATNGEAASQALSSFDDIYWIAGGIAKEDSLSPALRWLDRVRHVYLIGEASREFEAELTKHGVATTVSGDLAAALRDATADASADGLPAPVVLLSPACASFDQYLNFARRGDHFREIVMRSVGENAS
ncbi:MAG: UDP-N-acetylmuramoyl-L-alanine--D-glutamate ligase [Pseudomonadota bacterium]|nr:UDP-N-acetylmuramoyl-L-alanine--D-glutamate ligase [Pseudomonadota bacterium]